MCLLGPQCDDWTELEILFEAPRWASAVRSIPNCRNRRKCRKGIIRKQSSATRPRRMISRRGSPALKGSAIDQHRMRAAALSWTAAQLFGLSLVGHPGRSLRAVLSTIGHVVAAEVDPIRYADRLAFCRGLGLGGQWLSRTGHAGVRGIGRGAMRDLDRICHRSVSGISQGEARLDAARRSHRRGACGNRAPARVTGAGSVVPRHHLLRSHEREGRNTIFPVSACDTCDSCDTSHQGAPNRRKCRYCRKAKRGI